MVIRGEKKRGVDKCVQTGSRRHGKPPKKANGFDRPAGEEKGEKKLLEDRGGKETKYSTRESAGGAKKIV